MKNFLKEIKNEDIKKNLKKLDMEKEIIEKMNTDNDFNKSFIDYFYKIERGGRKDFWFYKVEDDINEEEKNKIKSNFSKLIQENKEKIYYPEDDSRKYFRVEQSKDNVLEFKAIQKKYYEENEPEKTQIRNGEVIRTSKLKELRHVSYYKISMNDSEIKILIGIDTWKDLKTKDKLIMAMDDLKIILEDKINLIKTENIKETVKNFLDRENIITKNVIERIKNKKQSAKLNMDFERPTTILKLLNDGQTDIEQLKTFYYTDDISSHEFSKIAEQNEIETDREAGEGHYYFYDNDLEEYNYFKFHISGLEARFRNSNDYIKIGDLENVFSNII